MVRLVLFDIDGTLILTGGAGLRAFDAVARHSFGCREGTDAIDFAGRTDSSIVREFFQRSGIPANPENFARFYDDYVFWLDHYLDRLHGNILPGVESLLRHWQARRDPPLIGLLTGNIRLGAEIKLRRFDLWGSFVIGAFGDDHESRNHLAAVARDRAVHHLGSTLEPSEILVIGDTPHDITCARAIGARCLAVATGNSTVADLQRHQPAWVCARLDQWDPHLADAPDAPPVPHPANP